MSHRRPAIAVPARNEEKRLPRLIAALGSQDWLHGGWRLPVVIVLNNCTDNSREAVLATAAHFPQLDIELFDLTLPPAESHVGWARRIAMDAALLKRCEVILTTDADAEPRPSWVSANLAAVAGGADIVGGRLIGDPDEERRHGKAFLRRAALVARHQQLADRLASLIDPLPYDPWPRHVHHTGGSLAIRADLYRHLGGLPPLACREDLALVSRARAAGARLRHAPDAEVVVSARLAGRTGNGMAECISGWIEDERCRRPILVEDPERAAARFRLRRELRELATPDGRWRNPHAPERLSLLSMAGGPIMERPLSLIERIAGDEPDAPCTRPIAEAIAQLEELVRDAERSHAA
ncbi:glycosyltransferase family 2 protein [Afifella sp. IM 167]|uniref:glycosyltransferase n=1 Tax=Afifella sp. IM 167 TaxID=2033586 RepID=UPI001CCE0729|nr:glycosyltransferase family A protein [Afifella sp. IM 167]